MMEKETDLAEELDLNKKQIVKDRFKTTDLIRFTFSIKVEKI